MGELKTIKTYVIKVELPDNMGVMGMATALRVAIKRLVKGMRFGDPKLVSVRPIPGETYYDA